MRRLNVLVIGLLLAAPALGAQPATARTAVGVRLGELVFAQATALKPTPFIGLEAAWQLPWSPARRRADAPSFGIGVSLDVSRPRTDGAQFPLAAVDRGDTTYLYAMAQRVTLVQSGVQAQIGVPLAGARVIGYAGGGWYAMLLGSRASGGSRRLIHPMASFGLAVDDPLTRTLSVRVQVGGTTYVQFNRSALDATRSLPEEQRIRDAAPAPAPAPRTPTNLQYSVMLRFTPGGV